MKKDLYVLIRGTETRLVYHQCGHICSFTNRPLSDTVVAAVDIPCCYCVRPAWEFECQVHEKGR